MSIKVQGLDKVVRDLEKINSPSQMKQCLNDSCNLVERSAKQKAPKGDGTLRRSITSEVSGHTGTVYTPLEYAPYVEYGTGLFAEKGGRKNVPWVYQDDKNEWHSTSGMSPRPYMRPALQDNRDEIIQIFKEAITQK